jgi:hypothetical protein
VPIGFGTDAAVFLMVIMPRVYLYEKAGMPIMKAIQAPQ